MNRSAPRPSRTLACSAKSSLRMREVAACPIGPIEPATKTSLPVVSRACLASFTAVELIVSSSSSRKWAASLRRFAPKLLVSIRSAPALMKLTWRDTTASGALTLASSGHRSLGTAAEMSAPIPPSATTSGPWWRRSTNREAMCPGRLTSRGAAAASDRRGRGDHGVPRGGAGLRSVRSAVARPPGSRRPGAASADAAYRRRLLDEHRGYETRTGMFEGFPRAVDWFRAALSREEVLEGRYTDYSWWVELSGGTRSPREAARRIRAGELTGMTAGATAEEHEPFLARTSELIAATTPAQETRVVVEGHARLTAYALFPERAERARANPRRLSRP